MKSKKYFVLASFAVMFILSTSMAVADVRSIQLQRDWNMFSLPVNKVIDSGELLKDCSVSSYVWHYNTLTQSYEKVTTLRPGIGYWVKLSSSCTITLEESSIGIANLPRLEQGWNQIGSTTSSTDSSGISGACDTVSGLWRYNSLSKEYELSNTIEPGYSYWINVQRNCDLGDLVGYWKFDESSGSIAKDSSSYRNDGSLVNMETSDRVQGKFGNALFFDGVDERVIIPNKDEIDFGNDDFTISLWMKGGTQEAYGYMFSKNYGGDAGVRWYGCALVGSSETANTGKIRCYVDDGTTVVQPMTNDVYDDDLWHNVVLRRDFGNKIDVFVDGSIDATVNDNTGSVSDMSSSSANNLFIGVRADLASQRWFSGAVDDFKIWDRALADAEIINQFIGHEGLTCDSMCKNRGFDSGACLTLGTGSEGSSTAQFQVTVDPSNIVDTNRLSIGINLMSTSEMDQWLNRASHEQLSDDADFSMVRLYTYNLDPLRSDGTYNWAQVDALVQEIFDRGAEPIIALGFYDGNGYHDPKYLPMNSTTGLPTITSFANYCREWVRHFNSKGWDVKYYEIMNEAFFYFDNNFNFNSAKARYFLDLYNPAYNAMHAEKSNVIIGNDASLRANFLNFWKANGGKLDMFTNHKYDVDNLAFSDSNGLIRGEKRNFDPNYETLMLTTKEARQIWGSDLPSFFTEMNWAAFSTYGTDPRIQKIIGATHTALVLRQGMLEDVDRMLYFNWASSKNFEVSKGGSQATGGFGFALVNSDDNQPWFPYYVLKWVGSNLDAGDGIVSSTSNSGDIRAVSWLNNGNLNILLIHKATGTKTVSIQGIGGQFTYEKIDDPDGTKYVRPWENIHAGTVSAGETINLNGYTVMLLQQTVQSSCTGTPIQGGCTSGTCCCSEAEEACSCTGWVSGSCGSSPCSSAQKKYTRTCTPTGCTPTDGYGSSKCEFDASCSQSTGTFWGANLYVPKYSDSNPSGYASTYLSNTVFQAAQEMGMKYILIWQKNFNEAWNGVKPAPTITTAQMVDAINRMKNYGLKPIIALDYNVNDAVSLVQALGSNCDMYEVCKEPHVSGSSCYTDPVTYAQRWNAVVSAARAVNPNAMYGGPAVGAMPGTSPTNSPPYMMEWLDKCDGDFVSVHAFFDPIDTQSNIVARARTETINDMAYLRDMLAEYGKEDLPIIYGEFQWSAASTTNGWDYDQNFNDNFVQSVMPTMEDEDVYAAMFWVLMGYDNNFAILRPPSQSYFKKPQFYSIQDYIASSSLCTGTISVSNDDRTCGSTDFSVTARNTGSSTTTVDIHDEVWTDTNCDGSRESFVDGKSWTGVSILAGGTATRQWTSTTITDPSICYLHTIYFCSQPFSSSNSCYKGRTVCWDEAYNGNIAYTSSSSSFHCTQPGTTSGGTVVSTELINFYGMTSNQINTWINLMKSQNIPLFIVRLNAYSEGLTQTKSSGISKVKQIIAAANAEGIEVAVDFHTWHSSDTQSYATWDTAFDSNAADYVNKRAKYIDYLTASIADFEAAGTNVYAYMVLNEPQYQKADPGENQFILDVISAAKAETDLPISVRFMCGASAYGEDGLHYSTAIANAVDFYSITSYWDARNPGGTVNGCTEDDILNTVAKANSDGKELWVVEFGKHYNEPNEEDQRDYVEKWITFAKNNEIDKVFCWVSQPTGGSELFNIFDTSGWTPRPAFYELVNEGNENLANILGDWDLTFGTNPQYAFYDYGFTHEDYPSIRIEADYVGTTREIDGTTWYDVSPGDRVLAKVWIYVEDSSTGDTSPYHGGRLGIDFYAHTSIGYRIVDSYPHDGQEHMDSTVDWGTKTWTQKVWDITVPSTYYTETTGWGAGEYQVYEIDPVQIDSFVLWLDVRETTDTGRAWFADSELYINP